MPFYLFVNGSFTLEVFSNPEKHRGGFKAFSLRRNLIGMFFVSPTEDVSTVNSSLSSLAATELKIGNYIEYLKTGVHLQNHRVKFPLHSESRKNIPNSLLLQIVFEELFHIIDIRRSPGLLFVLSKLSFLTGLIHFSRNNEKKLYTKPRVF